MKKLLFILLSVCIISCSPVAVHDLPEVGIKPDSSNLTIDITSETTLKARFTPVAYAKEYAIQIDDEPINTELTPTFENGYYSFNVWNPPTQGTITVFGRSSDSGENGGWVSLAEKSYEIVFKNILPNAYISKRTETTPCWKQQEKHLPNSPKHMWKIQSTYKLQPIRLFNTCQKSSCRKVWNVHANLCRKPLKSSISSKQHNTEMNCSVWKIC